MSVSTVTITGCGALGSLLAARLIAAGIPVQAYQRPGPHRDALDREGIILRGDRSAAASRYRLEAVSSDASQLAPSRLMIVLVKSYDTAEVGSARSLLTPEGVVLTLQNGLGNAEQLASMFGESRIAAGTATYGAYRLAPGAIGWGGDGEIVLGAWQAGQDLSWVAELLRAAGLAARYVENPRPILWRKLALNAMVNPVAALTRLKNGQTLEDAGTAAVMQQLGREAITAAGRAGVDLEFEEIWAAQEQNLRRTAANRNSMLQDVQSRRQTEVEAILGSVLRYATSLDEFPVTRALYQLLRAIDAQGN